MAKQALLICNGEPPSRGLARRLARQADVIYAADGGGNIARRFGIRPDVIIGDLDSITPATRRFFRSSTLIHVARQDSTDLEKALDHITGAGITSVIIIAATGRRLDFTLGNLAVIWNYASRISLKFAADDWTALPLDKASSFRAKIGTTVSLIPFGKCSGITLKGLQYPLHNGTMKVGEIGASNVVRQSPFSVRVRKGCMFLIAFGPLSVAP